jgi:hypothetical protein
MGAMEIAVNKRKAKWGIREMLKKWGRGGSL